MGLILSVASDAWEAWAREQFPKEWRVSAGPHPSMAALRVQATTFENGKLIFVRRLITLEDLILTEPTFEIPFVTITNGMLEDTKVAG